MKAIKGREKHIKTCYMRRRKLQFDTYQDDKDKSVKWAYFLIKCTNLWLFSRIRLIIKCSGVFPMPIEQLLEIANASNAYENVDCWIIAKMQLLQNKDLSSAKMID